MRGRHGEHLHREAVRVTVVAAGVTAMAVGTLSRPAAATTADLVAVGRPIRMVRHTGASAAGPRGLMKQGIREGHGFGRATQPSLVGTSAAGVPCLAGRS